MEQTIEGKTDTTKWTRAGHINDFPAEDGICVKIHDEQIAVFNFTSKGKWFATQNLCPHKKEMALSRGLLGDEKGEPKVACPFHKKIYSLETGKCLNDSAFEIKTYEVKVEGEWVYVGV